MKKDAFGSTEKTLFLIDISSFIFRAFYAIRALSNSKGEPVNAVYGVANMISKLVEDARPKNLAVVYDSKEPSFRKEIYEDYKANRTQPPDDLVPQFERIEQLISSLNIQSYRVAGVEADDIIAALTKKWRKSGKSGKSDDAEVVIVSGDKDLMQLVNGKVCLWDTMKDKVFHTAEVQHKFGIGPQQIRDYLAIVGDSSDNIPGVPSIGPKGAVQLLTEFGDLKTILSAAEKGKIPGKRGEVLKVHKKSALLSAELATLDEKVPFDWNRKDVQFDFQVGQDCLDLLRELEFDSLVTKWSKSSNQNEKTSDQKLKSTQEFRLVQEKAALTDFLKEVEKKGVFAFDLETTSLNPRQAQIVGYALSVDPSYGIYVPVGHQKGKQLPEKWVLDQLRPFLENPKYKKIGQNLKYDWSVLHQAGLKPDGIGADTMIAAYLVDPTTRNNMDYLAARYLNTTTVSYEEVCGKGKNQIGFNEVELEVAARYAAEDAVVTLRLWEKLHAELEKKGLMEVFARVELPLVPVLARMESVGVRVDQHWLKELSGTFEKEIRTIDRKIQKYVKGDEPMNLNSTKQLQKLLFEDLGLPAKNKTKTGYSTDARVLESLKDLHEVPRLLLEFREISKLKGTYVDPLPSLMDPKTNRIHGSFHQTVAATGRLSSSDPNLQNIPVRTDRGQMIRQAFVPSDGNVLLSCDYSQIELRILASMSGDERLTESFKKGEDVHRRTASELFKKDVSDVSDKERSIAKAINFGLMYGKTAFGLSEELKIPRAEAKSIIERYFDRYHRVKSFLDGLIAEASQKGFTETVTGRKRDLPELRSKNVMMRRVGERMAMNTPIQGTAADMIKLAMIELDGRLRKSDLNSKLMIQVHDELLLDCPKDEVDAARELVTEVMEKAMPLSVPLKVNASVGKNWRELK